MTKQELFSKYKIDASHNVWDNVSDNWLSIEVYRIMHHGKLPSDDDQSLKYVLEFLDNCVDPTYFFSLPNAGSMYITAKRMVSRYADEIVAELEKGNV